MAATGPLISPLPTTRCDRITPTSTGTAPAAKHYFTVTVVHRQVKRLRVGSFHAGRPIQTTPVGGRLKSMADALHIAARDAEVIARNVDGDIVIKEWRRPAGATKAVLVERIAL